MAKGVNTMKSIFFGRKRVHIYRGFLAVRVDLYPTELAVCLLPSAHKSVGIAVIIKQRVLGQEIGRNIQLLPNDIRRFPALRFAAVFTYALHLERKEPTLRRTDRQTAQQHHQR